jgi:hypothetical protein
MEYTVDYFIKKFEAISEVKFIAFSQSNNGGHCALGWCKNNSGCLGMADASNSTEAMCLHLLFKNAGIISNSDNSTDAKGWNVAEVNNGYNKNYQQPTPKKRILAALYDVKKIQQSKSEVNREDITKQLAVLPIDETSDIKKQLVNA